MALSARVPVSAVTGGSAHGVRLTLRPASGSTTVHTVYGPRPFGRPGGGGDGMRVAEDVSPLELRTIADGAAGAAPPADPATCPDASAPRLVSTRASQLRDDLGEVLHYTLLASGDIIRLRRAQDTLDGTAPALTRAGRPFDRRPYAYPVLIPSALG